MIDYLVFHQNLLGIDPDKTPRAFRVTPAQQRLYAAAEPPRHGFLLPSSKSLESWEHFLATFVLAYAQTQRGVVVFAVSAATQRWAGEQVKKIAHHIFGSRAKMPRKSIEELYGYFQNIVIGSNVLQVNEPARWVAYGFNEKDLLPPWMRGRLLSAGTSCP
jgi:hypothetical protein